jgi:hypothetical protein
MATLDHELGWLLGQEVFSVDGEPYFWRDVLVSAELRGALEELVSATRKRLACAQAASPEAVREAASKFRYQRGLLSAEELEAWLVRWHLSVGDLTEHLRRMLPSELGDKTEAVEEPDKAAAVDAICTGFLEREAKQLATDAALVELAEEATGDRRALVEQIVASAVSARAALAAGADVEREIAARALEWTRIDAELLELADPEAAREAALCVRIDGRSLAEVAADCGVPATRRELYLEEAEQERLTALLGANAGELVGPIERNGGFLLVHVHGRTRPSVDDPELRRRAQEYLVERASERAFETRVRWP